MIQQTNNTARVWIITGISSGLGKTLAEHVMDIGDFVIGTFRTEEQARTFSNANPGRGTAFVMDLVKEGQIREVAGAISKQYGRVDVLVNNAGFGFAGAIEEASQEEIREVFEANFFGSLYLTKLLLPLFRKQQSGHIIQISSHGGMKAFAGFGIYNASKFALEGVSEALASEIAPLGIKLTIVEPGPFRTNFAGNSFKVALCRIEDYAPTAGAFLERMKGVNGKQEGDPAKAAKAIFNISTLPNPPLRLPLGKVAIDTITAKLQSVQRDLDTWREVAMEATFESQ